MCVYESFWEHRIDLFTLACEHCGEHADMIVATKVSCLEPIHMAPAEPEPLPA